ncbi:MAG: GWxTD domain-containing protein [Bacteroidota bacterium]
MLEDIGHFNLSLADTVNGFVDFLDQQRIQLGNGEYDLEIVIDDLHSDDEPINTSQHVTVDYPNSKVNISEIELVESFSKSTAPGMLTKSGYDLVPYVAGYYPENKTKLRFYAEIYNTNYVLGESERYLVNYYLEYADNGRAMNSFRGFNRETAKKVNVVLSEFDIAELPSGNFNIVLEVRNRQNEVVAEKRQFFQRSNPAVQVEMNQVVVEATFVEGMNHPDTLREHIRSMRPIASEKEATFIRTQLKSADLSLMQHFFLAFWQSRNNLEPEVEWMRYRHEVRKVNKNYSTSIKKGYETDRGRVYLEYGPPNQISERKHDPASYPYEIWQYYRIKQRADARFVFYDNDLVTNDYQLLHSNVIGEINDHRWRLRLQRRSGMDPNLDETQTEDQFGNPRDQLFENPR